jgi:hypothetical protein
MGKDVADDLTTYIEEKITLEVNNKTTHLATKEDLAEVKGELKAQMSDNKADIIKWSFIFWVGQVIATFGFILLFLKK